MSTAQIGSCAERSWSCQPISVWDEFIETTKPFEISKHDVLRAWELVKANDGAEGVDGETIEQFESNLKGNLYKIWNRLSSGSYFPPPSRAIVISKKDGGERRLGIAYSGAC